MQENNHDFLLQVTSSKITLRVYLHISTSLRINKYYFKI